MQNNLQILSSNKFRICRAEVFVCLAINIMLIKDSPNSVFHHFTSDREVKILCVCLETQKGNSPEHHQTFNVTLAHPSRGWQRRPPRAQCSEAGGSWLGTGCLFLAGAEKKTQDKACRMWDGGLLFRHGEVQFRHKPAKPFTADQD